MSHLILDFLQRRQAMLDRRGPRFAFLSSALGIIMVAGGPDGAVSFSADCPAARKATGGGPELDAGGGARVGRGCLVVVTVSRAGGGGGAAEEVTGDG